TLSTSQIQLLSLHDALPIFKDNDKYHAKWEVKYNYFGKTFDSTQELTDTLDGPHTFIDGTVKVHEVIFNAQGEATVGEALDPQRSEEHTSELQSRFDLVCRL